MTKKMGRPRLAKRDKLGPVFAVRLRPDEAKKVEAAIHASSQTRAEWMRSAILAAAQTQ